MTTLRRLAPRATHRAPLFAILLAALLTLFARPIRAQDSSGTRATPTHVIQLRDGSTVVGRVVGEDSAVVRVETSLGLLVIPRSSVKSVRATKGIVAQSGEYWEADPHRTRLFFSPTGRMLGKGEGYFSDADLLLLNLVGGVSDRVTLGGGMSIIPTPDPSNNVLYVMPKVGLVQRENLQVAVGSLNAFAGFEDAGEWRSFGVVYGVATYGSDEGSITMGTGVGYNGHGLAHQPVYMIGGSRRVSRRVALLTENYVFPSADNHVLLSYGFRFIGDRIATDLAFINMAGSNTEFVFPGIPYVSIAVKF